MVATKDRPSARQHAPPRDGDREGDRPIERLTRAIVLASEAGRWSVVEALTVQLDRLTAGESSEPATAGVRGVVRVRDAG